jgi:hypothetical protein
MEAGKLRLERRLVVRLKGFDSWVPLPAMPAMPLSPYKALVASPE